MAKPAILYVSYDGMLEPLGQSQVIAYLERLAGEYEFHLLSFEKRADWADGKRRAALIDRLEAAGIAWHPLTYHKRPSVPATLFDIAQGTIAGLWLALRHRARIIHARSYVAALIALMVKRLTGAKLLFDMRGLWADERVDGGLWPEGGRLFRAVKRIEKSLLLGADHIVTLTEASVGVIEAFPCFAGRTHAPLTVIPTCADLERFSPGDGPRPRQFTLGYLGSIGTWYMFDELLACFRLLRARRPDARLLVVNRNEQDRVRAMIAEAGIEPAAVELTLAEHAEVPALVRRMSAGAAIIRPVYSKVASAPTKLAEYLACGVPCLGNAGVGDMEAILEGEGAGVAMREFTDAERNRAVDRLLELDGEPGIASRCRAIAEAHFSLDRGAEAYRAIYRELAG
jgi:glycosyltransferase involved in cell wall biosynthesis